MSDCLLVIDAGTGSVRAVVFDVEGRQIGIGLYGDLVEAADALVCSEREVEPNPAHRAIYDEAEERWQAAYTVQKTLVDRRIATPLWSAPGALAD